MPRVKKTVSVPSNVATTYHINVDVSNDVLGLIEMLEVRVQRLESRLCSLERVVGRELRVRDPYRVARAVAKQVRKR